MTITFPIFAPGSRKLMLYSILSKHLPEFNEAVSKDNSFAHWLYERDTDKYGPSVNRTESCTIKDTGLANAVFFTSMEQQELTVDVRLHG